MLSAYSLRYHAHGISHVNHTLMLSPMQPCCRLQPILPRPWHFTRLPHPHAFTYAAMLSAYSLHYHAHASPAVYVATPTSHHTHNFELHPMFLRFAIHYTHRDITQILVRIRATVVNVKTLSPDTSLDPLPYAEGPTPLRGTVLTSIDRGNHPSSGHLTHPSSSSHVDPLPLPLPSSMHPSTIHLYPPQTDQPIHQCELLAYPQLLTIASFHKVQRSRYISMSCSFPLKLNIVLINNYLISVI